MDRQHPARGLSYVTRRRFLACGAVGAASAALMRNPFVAEALPRAMAVDTAPASLSDIPVQTMQGFGAAGAWWPNDLVKFDPAVQRAVADMLFASSGIALSAYRYNIGGGGVGVTNPVRAPETFLVSPGSYDWTRDPGGRRFLALAAERGVPNLIGFVNSAPPIWTTSGKSFGGRLRRGAETAFAGYLADVVQHFYDDEGITINYLSPMNEPDGGSSSGTQEGMAVPIGQRATVVQALAAELATRAPQCRITADELSRIGDQFIFEVPSWLSVPGTAECVAALAHHLYDFPDYQTLLDARQVGEEYGIPLWSTEICCFDSRTGEWGQGFDPTIASAIVMAELIWKGIVYANDAAFHWWVACSSEIGADPLVDAAVAARPNGDGWNDGLLYYDPNYARNGNQRLYPTKRYYALGNFSRYVRPGFLRYEVSGAPAELRVMAFANVPPRDGDDSSALDRGGAIYWAIVAVNTAPAGTAPTLLRLQLPLAATRLQRRFAVETSASRNLEPVTPPALSAEGLLSTALPAQSITTLLLQ